MATVDLYLLADGTKRYRVRFRTPDNRATQRRGFTTKREESAFAATVEVSKMRGEYVSPAAGRVTVGQVAEQWFGGSARIKKTTLAARESAWSYRVAPRWAKVAIGDVRPSAVRSWVKELATTGVGAASIEGALLVLRGVLEVAVLDRALTVNPAAGILAPRRKHQRRGYLTIDQLQLVAGEVGSHRDQYATVVRFLALTGLRWGEMAALKVESFDMLRRRVNITEAIAEVRGKVVWDTPKDHEQRSVPFPAVLADELARLMAGKRRDALVFTGPTGAVLAVSRFRPRVFALAVASAQVVDPDFPTITPHDLRHYADGCVMRLAG